MHQVNSYRHNNNTMIAIHYNSDGNVVVYMVFARDMYTKFPREKNARLTKNKNYIIRTYICIYNIYLISKHLYNSC